ncbi:hypothetical protein IWW34DRAFT_858678 [Fusarium oxysporum f. sp. albedinis]|uniref:Transmembrane protein n=3 Tax=Fusarium oxysporum f. sp. conglutinans TaxID=100902 RepID=A0A8H6GAL4_FUSOX|nr:hypothetical protein HZS61_006252 [Fusarium oxysporum f. sp. conglutinans]KAI3561808.1 hypothetical protein IWW34DRAFT_860041 [Fusarium oxysporum f. sp. albedinis]KAI8395111.1 hypothetical protein FOFC_21603 [Fusarium oxysporum]KAK2669175.1 hypothetical protein RAB80_014701 [Fusarium oxysporum f. sp. vasinfectum]KAF6514303.1 hypothetical protein HZS61_006559 [Fusarium oxysporum f. sp. conglutinans]
MITLLSPHYVLQEVTEDDIVIASLAWGFTIGFGWLTTWSAMKQTKHIYKRHRLSVLRSAYVWMIWLEILVCLIFSIICWLHLKGYIPPSFAFYFAILTTWALQVQFLLQIIINRCSILLMDKKHAYRLKVGVAVLITAVNISVYTIWIPARLQISERYIWINEWWDRVEKAIYLIVDGALNYYFIRIVQRNLVMHGLTKYRSLVKFNMCIVGFSLSMDVLIISMMSLHNTFVYMQFHPFAYIVKLKIEMSMADLIGKVARKRDCGVVSEGTFSNAEEGRAGLPNKSFASVSRNQRTLVEEVDDVLDAVSIELQEVANGTTGINCQKETMSDADKFASRYSCSDLQVGTAIYTTREICIDAERTPSSHTTGSVASFRENGFASKEDDDTRPLRDNQQDDQKAIGLSTNIRANKRRGVRSPPPWKRAQ